jgi:serine protease Do
MDEHKNENFFGDQTTAQWPDEEKERAQIPALTVPQSQVEQPAFAPPAAEPPVYASAQTEAPTYAPPAAEPPVYAPSQVERPAYMPPLVEHPLYTSPQPSIPVYTPVRAEQPPFVDNSLYAPRLAELSPTEKSTKTTGEYNSPADRANYISGLPTELSPTVQPCPAEQFAGAQGALELPQVQLQQPQPQPPHPLPQPPQPLPQPSQPPQPPQPSQPLNFTPAYAPVGRRGKRKAGSGVVKGVSRGAVVAMMIFCLVFSAALGLGGGWLAANYFRPMEAPVSAPAASSNVQAENYADYLAERMAAWPETVALSPAQVTALAADSVVEIVTQMEVEVPGFNFWGWSSGSQIQEGAGSGVIISENGHIITNNHVIENAIKIDITLRDGKTYEAKLIATDTKSDVAVLKIEATGLPAATLGDSSALVVGEPAVVIGNPLGQLGGTVTSGIISALEREVSFPDEDGGGNPVRRDMKLLQTDASVNSGNSGGGLFNQYGELVGIVVAKNAGFSVEGLGFAIPINDVRDVIDNLITYGYVRGRIALGITLVTIPDEQAALRNNLTSPGVYIMRVEPDSNAERGGLKPGDRLTKVNGKDISEAVQVSEIVQSLSVGDTISVTYERNGVTTSVDILMQETVPADMTPATRLAF